MGSIIVLTGTICSGKGIVASELELLGFKRENVSDKIRDYLVSQGLPVNRDTMQAHGDRDGKEGETGYWGQVIRDSINPEGDYVVDSVKYMSQYDVLIRGFDRHFLLGVTAHPEIRAQRCFKRKRDGDPKTPAEFSAADIRDLRGYGTPAGGQDTAKCLANARPVFYNESTEQWLRDRARGFVKVLRI